MTRNFEGILTREFIGLIALKVISADRSEKFTFKYHVFTHVYNCFLVLNVKNVTLLAEKETIFALHKIVFETF